jgi:hypothetical protein
METKELTNKEKIKALKEVKRQLKPDKKELYFDIGLCHLLSTYLEKFHGITHINYSHLSIYFPEFNPKVAENFGGSPGTMYWWSMNPYDYKSRIKFINYLIKQQKKKTNKQLLN